MLSYIDLLFRQEQYKDLLQEADQQRLIRAAGLGQTGNGRLRHKVANWVGAQMVRWGYKLRSYGTAPSACDPQVAGCQ